jgi:glucose-6-phosphate 1-epimerase
VTNTGPAAFAFTCALHTYFAVAEVGGALVSGLEGCAYLDSLDGRTAKVDEGADVRFGQEV